MDPFMPLLNNFAHIKAPCQFYHKLPLINKRTLLILVLNRFMSIIFYEQKCTPKLTS